jgi:hypothetical protein
MEALVADPFLYVQLSREAIHLPLEIYSLDSCCDSSFGENVLNTLKIGFCFWIGSKRIGKRGRGVDVSIDEQVSWSWKFVAVMSNMLQFLHAHVQGYHGLRTFSFLRILHFFVASALTFRSGGEGYTSGCQNSWRKAAFQYTITYGTFVKQRATTFQIVPQIRGQLKK